MTEAFLNWVNSERKEFAPVGADSFLLELTHIENGGKITNNIVASLIILSIHFKFKDFKLSQYLG